MRININNFKRVICEHWSAILLALCVGTLVVLPTILSISQLPNGGFKGIYPLLSDDEAHYMTMIKEVSDGHIGMSNPYIKEFKEGPYTQPFLADIYYASFARLFGISIGASTMCNDFLLPFIVTLLVYAFFFRLTRSRSYSVVFSGLFFLYFIALFNRPVNPQFSFVILMVGFHVVWSLFSNRYLLGKLSLYSLILAICFGILVYVYPFYWMTLVVVYAGLTFSRTYFDRDYFYFFKSWLLFGIPSALFSVPFLINFYKLSQNPLLLETTIRNGYIHTHIPGAFLSIAPLIFVLCIVSITRLLSVDNTSRQDKILFYTLILGGIALNWQNIITGLTIQFTSHFYPISVLFSLVVCAILMQRIFTNTDIQKMYKLCIYTLCTLLFVGIGFIQKNSIMTAFSNIYQPPNISSLQSFADLIDWLNTHTDKDSAVYTLGRNYDWLIPVYTQDNIYFKSHAGIFLMSDTELEKRWAIENFFDTVNYSVIYRNREIWLDKFIDLYQSKEIRRKLLQYVTRKAYPETQFMDESYVNNVLKEYYMFKQEGFEKAVRTYDVDYIVLDASDPRYKDLPQLFSSYKSFEQVAHIDNTFIYKIK